MREIIMGEFFGTALLLLLGNGVCASVNAKKSGFEGVGGLTIIIGWGFAVMIPAYIFGAYSGAHFNPAVTLALCMTGAVPWEQFPIYVLSQMAGAIVGAFTVFLLYQKHFDLMEGQAEGIRGCFCTAPGVPSTFHNFLSEAVGTYVLVFAILGMAQYPQAGPSGVDKFFLYGIIVSIGCSLGGLTGYAINPARDLGPRIAYALMPLKHKTDPNWGYGWIPVVAPMVGAAVAVLIYNFIFV